MNQQQNKRKKTSNKKNTRAKKTAKQQSQKDFESFQDEVIIIASIFLAIFMVFSNFGLCGVIGDYVSGLFFSVFGYVEFVIPIAAFLGISLLVANPSSSLAKKKVILGAFLLLLCSIFLGLVDYQETTSFQFVTSYKELENGGGFIGGIVAGILHSALGVVGTYLLLIVLCMIDLVLLTERSLLKFLQGRKQAVSNQVKAKKEAKAKEEKSKPQEEVKENKSVFGQATVLPKEKKVRKRKKNNNEEMQEITPDSLNISSEQEKQEEEYPFPFTIEGISEGEGKESAKKALEPLPEKIMPAEVKEEKTTRRKLEVRSEEKVRKEPVKEERKEEKLEFNTPQKEKEEYQFPPISLLSQSQDSGNKNSADSIRETAAKLQETLKTFGVDVTMTNVSCGPAVTRYEMQPKLGVKVSKIVGLADDIKLNLAAADIRIEAPIPGKAAVGIEVPNKESKTVTFRELIENEEFKKHPSKISFAVGKDIGGKVVVTDIAKMPHLLIAGATGSGKSVCINTLIMSILYKAKPWEVKLIMIDPKVVELSTYNGIPHLMIPVVTDPKKASAALNWAVMEMTDRYKKFAEVNVRNLKGYNKKVEEVIQSGEAGENPPEKLPEIVIIVDELADLMMVAPGEVEDAIVRLSQLARAAGIHLVIATQRPSVNVITGLIKANVPSRIAFSVSSGVDSRTIIDMNGAEKLLGKGDMLFYPSGYQKPVRVQGAFVSDKEVSDVVNFLKEQSEEVTYDETISQQMEQSMSSVPAGDTERDPYFEQAAKFIIEKDKASVSMLQRVYKIGYNRAGRIMDQLEQAGVVGPEEGTKPRKVLMSEEQFAQYLEEYL
ncbi:MAG: DNA translocase FtsK [Lachnospiraceae bacterium]|nr:DNA translocase FtsK [Lachnospiraceae bacterium]